MKPRNRLRKGSYPLMRIFLFRAAALIGVVLALGFGPALAQPLSEGGEARPYLLQPGDTAELTVLEDPNLNRTVLVRPDGRITLPIAGSIPAAGRTPEAV